MVLFKKTCSIRGELFFCIQNKTPFKCFVVHVFNPYCCKNLLILTFTLTEKYLLTVIRKMRTVFLIKKHNDSVKIYIFCTVLETTNKRGKLKGVVALYDILKRKEFKFNF